MYHNDPTRPRACVWCGEANDTTLLLCSRCEEKAKELRAKRGEPIR